MQHIAYMQKSWHLTEKVATREKTIESRWYRSKRSPWKTISAGDEIFFKDSGEPIKLKARAESILRLDNLTPDKISEIYEKYWRQLGVTFEQKPLFFEKIKDKSYGILIFLEDIKKTAPFEINKKGFGAMSAWISIDNLDKIKL